MIEKWSAYACVVIGSIWEISVLSHFYYKPKTYLKIKSFFKEAVIY